MSDPNDPLGFGQVEEEVNGLVDGLDNVSEIRNELVSTLLDSFSKRLGTVAQIMGDMSDRIAKPLQERIGQAATIVNELQDKIKSAVVNQTGQARELTQQLDSTVKLSGLTSGTAGSDVAIGIPGGETSFDEGIATDIPPDEETNGGIAEDIPPDETVPGGGGGDGEPTNGGGVGNGGGDTLPGNGGQDTVPGDFEQPCPVGTYLDTNGNCVPLPDFCPPGTHWDVGSQSCVADTIQQCTPSCPAPVVQCPPPPDVNVTIQPPQPGGEETIQPGPIQPLNLPGPLGSADITGICKITAYQTGEQQPDLPEGLDVNGPIASLFYGPRFDIDAYIVEQNNKARSPGGSIGARIFPFDAVNAQIKRDWAIFVRRWDQWVIGFSKFTGCASPIFAAATVWQAVLSFMGIFFGAATDRLQRIVSYRANAFCPVTFPDQNEATEAYVRDEIDEEILQLWVEQNNYCWEPFKKLVNGRTNRVEPLMALQMWKRGFLTEEQFKRQVRKNGYTDNVFIDAFQKLGKFIPPITDLVRFMVRDVADKDIVDTFKLEDDFDKKWQDEVKEFGEQQGITEDVAKLYWRAHWRIPSPTQLFDMFHRTRGLPDGDPNKITAEMVETALKQDDLAPFWVKPMIARTYAIPTRRDARRQFETGAITDKQLKENLIKTGYTEKDADDLVRWAQINKTRVLLNQPIVRLFRDGLIDESRVRAFLAGTKLPLDDVNLIIEIAQKQGNKKYIDRCINAVRKRFLTGELTLDEANAEVTRFGLNTTQANAFAGNLLCEQAATGKQPPTAQLCEWLEMGTISPQEYVERLRRIGWSDEDSTRILIQCVSKINEKRAREADKLARQEAAAQEKAAREQQAAARKLERELANAKRQREKAERAKRNRDKLLQRAVARFAKDTKMHVDFAAACIQTIERQLAADTLLTIDERIQTIVLAVEKTKPTDCNDLKLKANQLADQLLEFSEITEEFLQQFQTVG